MAGSFVVEDNVRCQRCLAGVLWCVSDPGSKKKAETRTAAETRATAAKPPKPGESSASTSNFNADGQCWELNAILLTTVQGALKEALDPRQSLLYAHSDLLQPRPAHASGCLELLPAPTTATTKPHKRDSKEPGTGDTTVTNGGETGRPAAVTAGEGAVTVVWCGSGVLSIYPPSLAETALQAVTMAPDQEHNMDGSSIVSGTKQSKRVVLTMPYSGLSPPYGAILRTC